MLWIQNLIGNNAFRRGVHLNPLLPPPEWYNRYDCIIFIVLTNDYGHIDNETPSFAISLLKEYRNYGIGTELMKQMLVKLKLEGYKQASLAVQKMNYAVYMYRKVGFEIVDENDEEHIMICNL